MTTPAKTPPSTRDKMTGALYWTFLPRVVQTVVTLGTSVVIFRTLGEFDAGRLKIVQAALTGIIIFFNLGLMQALNRFVPEIRVSAGVDQSRALLFRCLGLQSGLWFFSVLALFLGRKFLYDFQPEYARIFLLGVLLSVVQVSASTMNSYAIASYKAREVAVSLSLGTLVSAGMTVALFAVGLRIEGVLYAIAIGHLANFLIVVWMLRRFHGEKKSLRTTGSEFPWSRLLRYAVPWVPNNFLHFLVWGSSETLLIGRFHSPEMAGFFDRAYTLPQQAMEFIPNAIYPLVLASFSESSKVTKERIPEIISYYYRLLFFAVVPIAYIGFVLGDLVVIALYGNEYAAAGPYCQVFFLIFMTTFFGTPLSMAIYVVEKVWVNLLLNVGYAAITIGLDLWLIPKYGLLGATIPTGFVTALTPFIRWHIAKRYVPGLTIPWAFILKIFTASSPIFLLFFLKPWADSTLKLLPLTILAGLVAALCYRVFRVLGPEERAFISSSKLPAKELILRIL